MRVSLKSAAHRLDVTAATRSGTRLMATALAAGTLAVLSIFLIFAIYYDASGRELRRHEIDQYLNSVGEATAWGVDNWISHRVTLAEEVVHELEQNWTGGDAVEFLKSPIYEQTFMWTYFGESNKGYHIWPYDEMPADYNPSARPWYQAAERAGKSTLTEPYFDITTGIETITVASPVMRDGELIGVVGADFSTETLSAVLNETDLGGLGYAFLVTSEGKILAHPDRTLVSRTLADAYPGDTPKIENRVQDLSKLEAPQIVTFLPIASLDSVDWYLGLSIDKKKAYVSLNEFRQSAGIATIAAALLMILVLGAVIHCMLVRPLMNARRAADAANIAKSEFLASMSHEIRTPMNGVLGMAEVLMNTNIDKRQKELASIIVSSGNALMTVINDILDFAKLEAGKMRLTPRSFNIRQMVYEVATMMQARALEKDLELIVRYAPNLPEGVVADDARLRQILSNLIGNAVKFTQTGYVLIEVTGERLGAEAKLHFSIKDTGIGMPEEQIPRMFERFEQADGSHSRQFGGTGLGLSICKNIVELMDGEIGAESELGKGARFWFTLTFPIDEKIKAMPSVNQSTFDGARILAVDDNAVNRRVLEELIAGWGMRATIVSGPQQAIAALEASVAEADRYHVILMDYQMPGEDGLALAARIQADERFSSIPTIILSSIDDVEISDTKEHVNIAATLHKPVRPSQLMDVLARVLAHISARFLNRTVKSLKDAQAGNTDSETAPEKNQRAKVLIAEDNVVNQLVISKFISEDAYEIIMAENGQIAVDLFKQHSPAIVLMDLSMPKMDGLEATKHIREYERERNLAPAPIIATTAHVLEEDRAQCQQAGMDDFIAKPIKKAMLDEAFDRWRPKDGDSVEALSA